LDKRAAEELIQAALQREDPAACELLWDRYAGDLLAFLQAVLCSRHDAEDVLQTIFVRIVHKRRHLAAARHLDAYVHQIARNEATSFLRQRRRKRRVERDRCGASALGYGIERAPEGRGAAGLGTPSDAQPWLVPSEAAGRNREEAEALQAALTRLPVAQREIVVLKTYQDKTFREIAAMLDLSLGTVVSRYRYGLGKLRALLKDPEP
jgi:RNA polymerase sigma-70 factor (ECF subfamily)